MDCDTRDSLNSLPGGADDSAASEPPVLTLRPETYNATEGTGMNQTLYAVYGEPTLLSLEPCQSIDKNKSCAAIASDEQDGDLTLFINVSCDARSHF